MRSSIKKVKTCARLGGTFIGRSEKRFLQSLSRPLFCGGLDKSIQVCALVGGSRSDGTPSSHVIHYSNLFAVLEEDPGEETDEFIPLSP